MEQCLEGIDNETSCSFGQLVVFVIDDNGWLRFVGRSWLTDNEEECQGSSFSGSSLNGLLPMV